MRIGTPALYIVLTVSKASFVLFAGNVGACQELPQGLNTVDMINLTRTNAFRYGACIVLIISR